LAVRIKLSTDPFFTEKVRDVVGLYLNPPDKALVLSVDEKSQIQALERTQPVLPMGLGYVEGVTHDYYRHGTTTLFAALNVLDGSVITQCKPRHRHQEFLEFLNHLDRNVPLPLQVHLILDNYGTHKHPKVKAWLARHPRYQLHYTPTYASWLNQIERWFGLVTQQAIRRGSFRNVRELVAKIDHFVTHYNANNRPFLWTATADSILTKVQRLLRARSDRAASAQFVEIVGAEAPVAKRLLVMLARIGGRALDLAGRAREARRGTRLRNAIDLDEGPTMTVVRMMRRLVHAEHRREAYVAALHDLAPIVARLGAKHGGALTTL